MSRNHRSTRGSALGLVLLLAMACREPTASFPESEPALASVSGTESPATVIAWNERARQLVITYAPSAPAATRVYAMLSAAQDAALEQVEAWRPPGIRPSSRGAVAGASADILTALFPAAAASLAAALAAEGASDAPNGPELRAIFDAGVALGTSVGDAFAARAASDGATAVVTPTIPVGPGYWIFAGAIAAPQWPGVRPWLMRSGAQFRPEAPPAFGSARFAAAQQEVATLAANRTAAQLATVLFWSDPASIGHHSGHWNLIARGLITQYHFNARRAARTLAVLNLAMADAMIGCFDAKYTYWLIRPYQVDNTISTPIGQPPHPSYPSAHSCQSGAAAGVLGAVFPAEKASLNAMEAEQQESRILAGIHYRFDVRVGGAIGRSTAALALAFDKNHGSSLTLAP